MPSKTTIPHKSSPKTQLRLAPPDPDPAASPSSDDLPGTSEAAACVPQPNETPETPAPPPESSDSTLAPMDLWWTQERIALADQIRLSAQKNRRVLPVIWIFLGDCLGLKRGWLTEDKRNWLEHTVLACFNEPSLLKPWLQTYEAMTGPGRLVSVHRIANTAAISFAIHAVMDL